MTQIIQQTLTLNEFHAALNKHKGRSALGVDRTTYVVWPSIEAKPAFLESLKLFLATPQATSKFLGNSDRPHGCRAFIATHYATTRP